MPKQVHTQTLFLTNRYLLYIACAFLTALASILLVTLLHRLNLNIFLPYKPTYPSHHSPLAVSLCSLPLDAAIEEVIFRGFPILIMGKLKLGRYFPAILILTSVVFSLAHTSGHTLPLIQLLFGGLTFHVAYREGLRYSMTLHAFNNIFIILIIWLLSGKFVPYN